MCTYIESVGKGMP